MPQKKQKHLRVLADGWGQQPTGSVFCADSSLRYIYESTSSSMASAALPLPARAGPIRNRLDVSHVNAPPKQLFRPNSWVAPLGGTDALSTESQCGNAHQIAIARACHAIVHDTRSRPASCHDCSVCFSANAVAQLSGCGHTFHPQCFLRWFRSHPTCPLCREPVDKIHPVVAPASAHAQQQNELEALMAEMDQDPLLGNADQLMSLFETELDTDMDLVALEAFSAAPGDSLELTFEHEAMADETMATEMMEREDGAGDRSDEAMPTMDSVAMQPSFAPASTIPNYWNVLNQGTTVAAVPVEVAPQRMVHIVPKTDDERMQDSIAMSSRTTEGMGKRPTASMYKDCYHYAANVTRATAPAAPRVVSCRCTGGCKNGRCACVKDGSMCGISCRCTSCKNPYLMVKAAGADLNALLKDDCFMHNVSKTRDMVQRLQEPVSVPCCGSTIKVVECVQGYTCELCNRRYDFSWCMNKLLASERTPRNHCAICRRCCDHRDVHCHDCGRCYFAGVVASLPCPCKEALSHKKHREAMAQVKAGDEAEDEAEGECCIM